MYFLEEKIPYTMPNVLGNHSMPVSTYRWRIKFACKKREPLEKLLNKYTHKENYRITSNEVNKE